MLEPFEDNYDIHKDSLHLWQQISEYIKEKAMYEIACIELDRFLRQYSKIEWVMKLHLILCCGLKDNMVKVKNYEM